VDLFKKLPGYVKEPPGLEMEILRLAPGTFLLGTLLIALPSLLARAFLWPDIDEVKLITTLDFFALGAILVHWTALITAICGAVLVRIMKGPAYVADAYPLSDADSPPRTSPKPKESECATPE
jgi:hypothetical protein